ncbi:MAG: succinate dehydrogenase, cytochrome b556 subunit [Pseudomonadota bacterium]
MRMRPHRAHKAYWAFIGHRLSGLALALFLPLHFLTLATALDAARFDEVLAWTENPLVKIAEWGLLTCLGLHLMFGLRLLMIEFAPLWTTQTDSRDDFIGLGVSIALVMGLVFMALAI